MKRKRKQTKSAKRKPRRKRASPVKIIIRRGENPKPPKGWGGFYA